MVWHYSSTFSHTHATSPLSVSLSVLGIVSAQSNSARFMKSTKKHTSGFFFYYFIFIPYSVFRTADDVIETDEALLLVTRYKLAYIKPKRLHQNQ